MIIGYLDPLGRDLDLGCLNFGPTSSPNILPCRAPYDELMMQVNS